MCPLSLLVVHQDRMGMRFGGDHPTDQRRHQLAVALCRETGLFALLTPQGGRAWGSTTDADTLVELESTECVGRAATLSAGGDVHLI